MLHRFSLSSAALAASVASLLAVACSSASPPVEVMGFKAPPLVTTASTTGALDLDVRTSPQPPIEGLEEAQVVITDHTTGEPVDGLSLGVVPWMPAMGHGTSLVPTVLPKGNGVYEIDQLSLFMGGEWELRLSITGPMQDTANPAFDVP
jgi:hypothetical protein